MVRRVFRAVYQEVKGLHQAAYVLALFTFGSQLLALLRDRLLAHQFGVLRSEADAYAVQSHHRLYNAHTEGRFL